MDSDEEESAKSSAVIERSPLVFQTFETDAKLEGGLCIVRPLGGGKYEIVNLSQVDQEAFSSKDIGATIKGNRGRLNALDVSKEQWDIAAFKCSQAVASSSKIILPLSYECEC